MQKKIYLNRYSDRIIFERLEPLKFRMTGFMPGYSRRMIDLDGKVTSFDPPGGPMVSINETDMGGFNKKWADLKIESIEFETPDYQSVIITCRYDLDISNMKWKTIKNPA
jgi:hypothetical protein